MTDQAEPAAVQATNPVPKKERWEEANDRFERYTGTPITNTRVENSRQNDYTPLWAVVVLILGLGLLLLLFLLFYHPVGGGTQVPAVITQEQNVNVETIVEVICGDCGKKDCKKSSHKKAKVKKTVTKSSGGSSKTHKDEPKPKPPTPPTPTPPCPPANSGPGTTPFVDTPGAQPPDAGGNAGPTPGAGPGTNQGSPGEGSGSTTIETGDTGGF